MPETDLDCLICSIFADIGTLHFPNPQVDGTAVAGREVKDVLALVRGPSGSAVTIKVL